MNSERNNISFLLPIKNENISVARTLKSILNQKNIAEIVVVDGGADKLASKFIKSTYPRNPIIKIIEVDSSLNKWKKLRKGVRQITSEYVMIGSSNEWLSEDCIDFLSNLTLVTDTDCVQLSKTRRIRNLAIKSPYDITGSLNTNLRGEDYMSVINQRGENRLITKEITDKVYRTPLLKESLNFNFDSPWGTEEILNLHYFRHARSIVFSDYSGINLAWATPPESFEFKSLADLRKVYEIKLIVDYDKEGVRQELRKDLNDYINMMISQLGWTREALSYYMSNDISDPFWREAGIQGSVEDIINDAIRTNNHNSFVNILKRLLR